MKRSYAEQLAINAAYSRQRRQERKDFIHKIKQDKPCADCGQIYPPYVMEFDHLEPSAKLHNVSTLAGQNYAFDTRLEEIAKCELVCSNCHKERTFGNNVNTI